MNHVSKFSEVAEQLDASGLIKEYEKLVRAAPRRHERGKKYFVSHEIFVGKWKSTRKEEQIAGALFNACQQGVVLSLPNDQELKIIDYQFPLKSKQNDQRIGAVDLFGVVDGTAPTVIELKVARKKDSTPDTPLKAFLQGLAYCAMVEANLKEIAEEAQEKFDLDFEGSRPALIVLAPDDYWHYFSKKKAAGNWGETMNRLVAEISQEMNLSVQFLSMKNPQLEWGAVGKPPELKGNCKITSVEVLTF